MNVMKRLIILLLLLTAAAGCLTWFLWSADRNELKAVILTSPRNTAMYNRV